MRKYKESWEFNKNYVTTVKRTALYDSVFSFLLEFLIYIFLNGVTGSCPPNQNAGGHPG